MSCQLNICNITNNWLQFVSIVIYTCNFICFFEIQQLILIITFMYNWSTLLSLSFILWTFLTKFLYSYRIRKTHQTQKTLIYETDRIELSNDLDLCPTVNPCRCSMYYVVFVWCPTKWDIPLQIWSKLSIFTLHVIKIVWLPMDGHMSLHERLHEGLLSEMFLYTHTHSHE